MRRLAIALIMASVCGVASAEPAKKDTIVVGTPHGGPNVEVRVPHDIATVRQTGPRTYEVTINHEQTKKVEIYVHQSPHAQ